MTQASTASARHRSHPGDDSDSVDSRLDDLQELSLEELQARIQRGNAQTRYVEQTPQLQHRLGVFSVFCLILNRTIGTGIFAQPGNVLFYAGSSALALLLWAIAGVIVFLIMLSWLELGLTIPRHYINGSWLSTPRNGADKNYLEYIFQKPRFLITCVFGITYGIFGNMAGNAIQLGVYMENAIHPFCIEGQSCYSNAAVLGWAIGALTLCSLLNVISRTHFLGLNNFFAVLKCVMLVITIILGFISAARDGCSNLNWEQQGPRASIGDITSALIFAIYSYTGFDQAFYVLAEIRRPRRTIILASRLAMAVLVLYYILANVGYLCVVPYTSIDSIPTNMVLKFYEITVVSNQGNWADATGSPAQRALSVILAFFALGNIAAQTYVGTRMYQYIAREGVLPWSKLIGSSTISFVSLLKRSRQKSNLAPDDGSLEGSFDMVPVAATALHLILAIVLVLAVGLSTNPSMAYRFLTFLRTFSLVIVLGYLTVGGLAYLQSYSLRRTSDGELWKDIRQWTVPLSPLPTFMACAAIVWLLVTVFVPTARTRAGDIPWWIAPLVGWLTPLLGVFWWLGLRFRHWSSRTKLEVQHMPYISVDQDGEAVMVAEIIDVRVRVDDGRDEVEFGDL